LWESELQQRSHRVSKAEIMKLATIVIGTDERVGLVHSKDTKIFDLAAAAARRGASGLEFSSMLALIDSGQGGLDRAGDMFERMGKVLRNGFSVCLSLKAPSLKSGRQSAQDWPLNRSIKVDEAAQLG
jgi:hypothetical protein